MEFKRIVQVTLTLSVAATLTLVGAKLSSKRVHADDDPNSEAVQVAIGLRIAPSFINMEGKDPNLVGLGSFIVNAQADCNGCHGSDPANEYLPMNNPFFRKPNNHPVKFNQATYLNGGQNFGPAGPGIVQDVTSPLYGLPEGGRDLETFMKIIRTGHDFDQLHPNCGGNVTDNCYSAPVDGSLLQVMPWPKFRNMTDHQIEAIWTYLSTVPCNAHNDALGDQFPWLKNVCQ